MNLKHVRKLCFTYVEIWYSMGIEHLKLKPTTLKQELIRYRIDTPTHDIVFADKRLTAAKFGNVGCRICWVFFKNTFERKYRKLVLIISMIFKDGKLGCVCIFWKKISGQTPLVRLWRRLDWIHQLLRLRRKIIKTKVQYASIITWQTVRILGKLTTHIF